MTSKNAVQWSRRAMCVAALSLLLLLLPSAAHLRRSEAQPSAFLSSPYYGSKVIGSYFDHQYPRKALDVTGSTVIYTGDYGAPLWSRC